MELGLFIDRVYWSLVKKKNIKNNKKTYDGWLSKCYNNTSLYCRKKLLFVRGWE